MDIPTIEAGIAWMKYTHRVSEHFSQRVRVEDFSGKRLACSMHLLPDTILLLEPLVAAGVTVCVSACNPDSTDTAVAAYLRELGIEVFEARRDQAAEHGPTLERFAGTQVDAICDMGGELIETAVRLGTRVGGALEATTTGLHRIRDLPLGFPVFNWNDVAIKDALHNRYHVGEETWPAFNTITGMSLFGRTVLVIGFGPVGRGVAERARALGAIVLVAERDPVRQLEAGHFGCRVVPLQQGLNEAHIAVCATGRDGILGAHNLTGARPGLVVFNVGHSHREIDVDWLETHPRQQMKEHIERFDLKGGPLFLLNRGSMINLASSAGFAATDSFDPFTAIMLRGLQWILAGGCADQPGGLFDYPTELENEVATVAVETRS